MSSCTQEGYKCITLAVAVQEGLLFGRYFSRSRSQGAATLVSEPETSRLVYEEVKEQVSKMSGDEKQVLELSLLEVGRPSAPDQVTDLAAIEAPRAGVGG